MPVLLAHLLVTHVEAPGRCGIVCTVMDRRVSRQERYSVWEFEMGI